MSNVIALQDMIALDPPSAGTKSPDNPLKDADLIFARYSNNSRDCLVFPTDWLNRIIATGISVPLSEIVVLIEDPE
jgi:hypothetical protein